MLLADKINVLNDNIYCYQKKRKGSVTSIKKKTEFSPVDVFYEILKIEDENKKIILDKYFLKAAFWISKMRDDLKKEYCLEFEKILKIMKTDYKNDYYAFFNPKYYDSYLILKLKYIISKLKTKTPYLKDKILKF